MDFPIAAVSRHSARDKSIRHGHPSTLHLWWVRGPLASEERGLSPYDGPVTLYHVEGFRNLIPSWEPYIKGRLETIQVPGNHHALVLKPHVARLAEAMSASLEKIRNC